MQMLAGAMIAPVLPKIALSGPAMPILWGDGIHDDAPALKAFMRGDIIEFADARMGAPNIGWEGVRLTLPRGVFKLNAPISIDGDEVQIAGKGIDQTFVIQKNDFPLAITRPDHNRADRRKAASNRRATP
jgi:hypothetical protein